jgi:hypothetical protein
MHVVPVFEDITGIGYESIWTDCKYQLAHCLQPIYVC